MEVSAEILEQLIPASARGGQLPAHLSTGKLDVLTAHLMQLPQLEHQLVHRFTPKLYVRELTMPAGSLWVSKIHKTEHPFTISKGRVSVYAEGEGVTHMQAPFTGITKPGTRRMVYVHEDTVWTTFHVTDSTDLVEIEKQVIQEPSETFEIGGES